MNPREMYERPDWSILCARSVEGQVYERKVTRQPELLAQAASGFANYNRDSGGLLAVGIADNGEFVGLNNLGERYINKLLTYRDHINFPTEHRIVDCTNKGGTADRVLLIYVPFLPNRVAETTDGKAYKRVGDRTIVLRDAERRELEYQKGQVSFEDEPSVEYDPGLLASDVLDEYVKAVTEANHLELQHRPEDLLLGSSLLTKHNDRLFLSHAGLLLLGKDPRRILPGAHVRFLRFEGREDRVGTEQNIVKDEIFAGPLPKLVMRLREFLRTQIRTFSYQRAGKFVDEPEYPETVWDEALINALVHRSYSFRNVAIFIRMFDDRLEVVSAGDYPLGVTPDEFRQGSISNPRNPHLMEGMKYLRYVRMRQEGTRRMFQEMEQASLPPPEFSAPGKPTVTVILRNDIDNREPSRRLGQVPQFANLFFLRLAAPPPRGPVPEAGESPPTIGDIKNAFIESLREHGWTVDDFTKSTAVDFRDEVVIQELRESGLASIYPGFRFRLMQFGGQFYLCLDPTVEVRNRATLADLLQLCPHFAKRRFRRAFVRLPQGWTPCFVLRLTETEKLVVRLKDGDEKSELEVGRTDVIPLIPTTWIAELLAAAGVRFDIFRKIKQLTHHMVENAPRARAARTEEIAAFLQQNVFPIQVGLYTIQLENRPARLASPLFEVRRDLVETEPVFDQGRSASVLEGITTYGAYQKPNTELPLVLLSTPNRIQALQELVRLMARGSYRYKGLERTFGLRFGQPVTYVAPTPKEYYEKCEEIVSQLNPESQTVFLIYCPERGYSRADYEAPYYRLKHLLLEKGFPSQMVDEDTLANPNFKDLNLALDIFAKAGFVPWVLAQGLPAADLFVGLSYSSIQFQDRVARLVVYVNIFDKYGRWQYYKGNSQPVPFGERNAQFRSLLRQVVTTYQAHANLQRIHVHYASKMRHEDREEIAAGVFDAAPEAEVSFVYLNRKTPVRIYDERAEGDGSLPRGHYVITRPNQFYISTTGSSELDRRVIGTPEMLEVTVNRIHAKGQIDLRIYAQHVLSLTRLNWASTKSFCHDPITIKFASDIAYLMNVFLTSFGSFNLHPRLERTPWFL